MASMLSCTLFVGSSDLLKKYQTCFIPDIIHLLFPFFSHKYVNKYVFYVSVYVSPLITKLPWR